MVSKSIHSIVGVLLLLAFFIGPALAQTDSSFSDTSYFPPFLNKNDPDKKAKNKFLYLNYGLSDVYSDICGCNATRTYGDSPAMNLLKSNNFRIGTQRNIIGRKAKSAFHVALGLQFIVNDYVSKEHLIVENRDSLTFFYAHPTDEATKSKLKIGYIGIPLNIYYSKIKENGKPGLTVGIGGAANYKIYSKTKMKLSGKRTLIEKNDYNLESFQFEGMATLGYSFFSLYMTYALNPMFQANKGPTLNWYSYGIRISPSF